MKTGERTRQRILAQALVLFNERGTDSVSLRELAQALGISHGNLCYHFANTDALVSALYFQLAKRQDTLVGEAVASAAELTPSRGLAFMRASFEVLFEYRFLMLDFVRVMRRLPEVRAHYQGLVSLRRQQFAFLLGQLRSGGWLLAEAFEGQHALWTDQALIMGDFWIASGEILYTGAPENRIGHYVQVFAASLAPMLTAEGLREMGFGTA